MQPNSSSSSDESDNEFQAPEGFQAVETGKTDCSIDQIINGDKELWLFRLPKKVKATNLANQEMLYNDNAHTNEREVLTCEIDDSSFNLKEEPTMLLPKELVTLFPAKNSKSKHYVYGKPFTRSFTLVKSIKAETPNKASKRKHKVEEAEVVKKKKKKSKH